MFVFIDLSHMIKGQPEMGVRRGGEGGGRPSPSTYFKRLAVSMYT